MLGTTTANASGVWSFTPSGLAQGLQTITASETNVAGVTGSSSLTFTYETTGAPTVTIALADDTSGGKDITSNDALTGTADPNATVKISEGSTVLGTTTANASGVWSFTPTSLTQGLQTITASETNAAGLAGSASLTFTYETTAPKVTIKLADDTSGGKNITSYDALTGTADANATVKISEGSTVLGTTTANGSGIWSFTPTGLAQGLQTVTASETNAAGLTGSSALTFTYETTPPKVTIALVDDTSGGKNITSNDALTGTADPNATVKISEGATVLGTTTANASGVWSFTPTGLPQGLQTISASETNPAGLTGYSYLTFTYDTAAPTVTAETMFGSAITAGAGVLTAGQTVQLAMALTEAVTVSGGSPSLALNDGGTATFDAAHSTATSLVFDYTVATGQYVNALAVTSINLNGASVTDVARNAADFAGADNTFANVSVDATTPVVTGHHVHSLLGGSASISASSGALGGASGLDPSDVLGVSAVDSSSANVGHSISGSYGTLTLNPDGSYTYSNANPSGVTAAGGVAEDLFNYTISNGHGGTASATLAVLITSPNEIYKTGSAGSTLTGGSGNYVLDGSAGNMHLTAGNQGQQWLVGGAGDVLTGGKSIDTFMFAPGFGKETINSFNPTHDVIDLPQSMFANFAAIQADMQTSGTSTIIEVDPTDVLTLTHVSIASLHASNFHFLV
jgi:VCBS repeat-containing protein